MMRRRGGARAAVRSPSILNFIQHHGRDKTQVAERRLPINAGLCEYRGAPQQRLVASPAKQVEDSLVFRAHARPKARKRRHVKVLPVAETALLQHMKAVHASGPARIGANDVMGVLPIAHRRVRIIVYAPAAGGSYLVEPPVVRRHVHVGAAEHNELARFLIEYHGVAAGDALHQRASEFRLSVEYRRKTDLS